MGPCRFSLQRDSWGPLGSRRWLRTLHDIRGQAYRTDSWWPWPCSSRRCLPFSTISFGLFRALRASAQDIACRSHLPILLALCIVAFVIRRLHEERRDAARQVTAKTQLRQFRWRASRDSLTNLANRRSMLKALAAVTASSRSDGRKHAFLLM